MFKGRKEGLTIAKGMRKIIALSAWSSLWQNKCPSQNVQAGQVGGSKWCKKQQGPVPYKIFFFTKF